VPGQQRRQAGDEQFDRLRGDGAGPAEPGRAHEEDRDPDRLKHRTLFVFRPAAHAAPDRHQNAGKPGDAAENAVEESDAAVRERSARDRFRLGAHQRIDRIEDEECTDTGPDMGRIGPVEDRDAERHAKRAAGDERPQLAPIERSAQLPDRDTLHDQAVGHDQARGLDRRDHMQPDRGRNDPEGKSRKPGHHGGRECRNQKHNEVDESAIHRPLPCVSEQRLDGMASDGEAAGPRCGDIRT
jgi:hypothetical protein